MSEPRSDVGPAPPIHAAAAATPKPEFEGARRSTLPCDDFLFPAPLSVAEQGLIESRRKEAGVDPDAPLLGIACSGGGIRSATLCLGFFQALAAGGLLKSVDYMSTVSGGGYFGSFLGGLYSPREGESPVPGTSVPTVVAALTDRDSNAVRHLRENGRYVAPRGASDYPGIVATYLRNWSAIQYVVGVTVLAALLGLLLVRHYLGAGEGVVAVWLGIPVWYSSTVILVPLCFVALTMPLAIAFWLTQSGWGSDTSLDAPTSKAGSLRSPVAVAVYLLFAALLVGAWREWASRDLGTATLLLAAALVILVSFLFWLEFADDNVRNRLTAWLARSLVALVVLAVVAFVDTASQTAYAFVVHEHGLAALFSALGAGGVIAFVAHRLAPLLTQSKSSFRIPATYVAAAAGFLVLAIVLVGMGVAANAIRYQGMAPPGDPASGMLQAKAPPPPIEARVAGDGSVKVALGADRWKPVPSYGFDREGLVLGETALLAIIAILSGYTLGFVNLSSLQQFYSARLKRAYIGASNPMRTGFGHGDPASVRYPLPERSIKNEIAGDDIDWRDYRPHAFGGPIHLVNVTVNETISAISNIETQDRKGYGMTFGPAGISARQHHHAVWVDPPAEAPAREADGTKVARLVGGVVSAVRKFVAAPGGSRLVEAVPESTAAFSIFNAGTVEANTVSRLVSISGAAFSTGMGANTLTGLSILLALANVRLGYWWYGGGRGKSPLMRPFMTQRYLYREMFAQFAGATESHWYLSDGGHFENTGAYELIRRRLPFIVILDHGADPHYIMDDLAGLVRKARMELDADVRFLDAATLDRAAAADPRWKRVGPLETLRRARDVAADRVPKLRRVAAARITYGDKTTSLLFLVKPVVLGDERADVRQYALAHDDFPQQPTADQFFDESQWESYRQIGYEGGLAVQEVLASQGFAGR